MRIAPGQNAMFGKVIRAKLRDKSSTFANDYLSALVDEVRVVEDTATITGNAALVEAGSRMKEGTAKVPSLMREWRARQDESRHWSVTVQVQASVPG